MALFAMPILQLNMKRTYDGTSSTETEGDVVICSFLKLTALHNHALCGHFEAFGGEAGSLIFLSKIAKKS